MWNNCGLFWNAFAENRVYMKIKVDPLEPSAISTTFFGPTKSVERYRQIYREKIDEWSLNDDIYQNFLRIFGTFNSWTSTEHLMFDSKLTSIFMI